MYRSMYRPGPKVESKLLSIVVLGIGGGGCNTVTTLFQRNVNAKLIAVDTDVNTLTVTKAHHIVQIGESICNGRGTGGDIAKGRKAAEEDYDKVLEVIGKPDLLLAVCGLGGGTGSGALPVILAKFKDENPNTTIGIVGNLPFSFEGVERLKNSQIGLKDLLEVSDFIIVNSNDILFEKYGNLSIKDSFKLVDVMVANMIESLVDALNPQGSLKHVDFADFVSATRGTGLCVMGFGKHRLVRKALEKAIENKLLDADISTAKTALVLIRSTPGTTLKDAGEALKLLSERFGIQRILWGLRIIPELKENTITLIAGGIKSKIIHELVGEVELVKG